MNELRVFENSEQAVQRLDDNEKSMLNIGLFGGTTNYE